MIFKIGDCVKVKDGTSDPDYPEIDISAWQGRVVDTEIDEEGELYVIAWDSISLAALESRVILDSIAEGIDYSVITLFGYDLEKATPRDREKDVEIALAKLEEEYFWSDLGELGDRIRKVLKSSKSNSEKDRLFAWEKHLKSNLKLPLEVVFVGDSDGPFKEGSKYNLISIDSVSEIMGIMGKVEIDRGTASIAICDLDVEIENDYNRTLYEYCIWYANH